jgi:hypothetical protein
MVEFFCVNQMLIQPFIVCQDGRVYDAMVQSREEGDQGSGLPPSPPSLFLTLPRGVPACLFPPVWDRTWIPGKNEVPALQYQNVPMGGLKRG